MSWKSLIPYWGDRKVREQMDKLFSREVLGSVLAGKFIGDYCAILMTQSLGVHLGYGLGIIATVVIFVYWEKMENKATETKNKSGVTPQTHLDDW